jgi:hypothetical protein
VGFEETALARLGHYREEAELTLSVAREIEETARRFSGRLFAGLEYTAALGRKAGFEIEATHAHAGQLFVLRLVAAEEAEARVAFGLVGGAAAETDEDLLHEELSRYTLHPSGYSGRILGFSEAAGERPCQVFAVYRDGVWKTKGLLVEKARGRVNDPEEVLNGFCLRILGRLVDLAVPTQGAGRRWSEGPYALADFLKGKGFPTETRWLR